tara:strand:+ start:19770 stop:19937 length:168 start_codon:yes stop_codon:yes gene_type:complete
MVSKNKIWLSSKEVKSFTKTRGCDLMHFRESGKLEFKKIGNTYFYSEESIKKMKT